MSELDCLGTEAVPPNQIPYDAVLLLSFGGPEKPSDVLPFLENVLRGKNVPQQRMLEVAEHYYLFGGISPINAQNRALLTALVHELNQGGPHLPVYWGNRNWHPLLEDTLRQMADDGIRRALAFVTSAFGSYSGCRQYLEDIERARREVGPDAPQVDKLRIFYNHPGFVEPMAERVKAALDKVDAERRDSVKLIYTAHSVPLTMASQCRYEDQLREACGLVSQLTGKRDWRLAYQSRSGPASQPWLEPDVGDLLVELHRTEQIRDVVIAPIGFLSEHMEVIYDLDIELQSLCDELGINMIRSALVGNHPRFIAMIRELILERMDPQAVRPSLGSLGPGADVCPPDCCARR